MPEIGKGIATFIGDAEHAGQKLAVFKLEPKALNDKGEYCSVAPIDIAGSIGIFPSTEEAFDKLGYTVKK